MGIEFLTAGTTTGAGLSNPVSTAQGGFGINAGASTGIPQLNAGVTTIATLPLNSSLLTSVLPLAKGGWATDLSATGGPNFIGKQTSVGGTPTFAPLTNEDWGFGMFTDVATISESDDFMAPAPSAGGNYYGKVGLKSIVQNSGTLGQINPPDVNHLGVHRMGTALVANAGSAYLTGANFFNASTSTISTGYFTFRIPTFATAGEDGLFWVGFLTNPFAELTTGSCVVVGVDRVTDTSHFTVLSVQATVVKVRAATTTTAVAGNWYTAKVVLNANGNVNLYIAPGAFGTFTELSQSPVLATNAPLVAANMGLCAEVYKIAGTTVTLNLDCDRVAYDITAVSR